MSYPELATRDLLAKFASGEPAPGGGSASALAGALAGSLAQMVCRLTVGKKNYEGVEAEVTAMLHRAEAISERLLASVEGDAAAFDRVMAAMALPKGTDEEKAARSKAMQEAFQGATTSPIGVAQACALIPGTSRSGSTIAAGLFMGLKREDAARFSFLLGFPVILGSAVFQLKKLLASPAGSEPLALALGVAASAVSGYFCIRFLIRYLQKHGMAPFIVYRLALGLLILGLLLSGHAPSFAEPGH